MLTNDELAELLRLLEMFRDEAPDRVEFENRDMTLNDVEDELNARGEG